MTNSTTTAGSAVRVGPGSEIPVGEGRAYAVDGDQVAVFRLSSGALRAVSAICPLHLNVFELDTGCSRSGQEDLRSYPVDEDADGYVVVQTP